MTRTKAKRFAARLERMVAKRNEQLLKAKDTPWPDTVILTTKGIRRDRDFFAELANEFRLLSGKNLPKKKKAVR